MCTSARYASQYALALLVFVRSAGIVDSGMCSPFLEDFTPAPCSA